MELLDVIQIGHVLIFQRGKRLYSMGDEINLATPDGLELCVFKRSARAELSGRMQGCRHVREVWSDKTPGEDFARIDA